MSMTQAIPPHAPAVRPAFNLRASTYRALLDTVERTDCATAHQIADASFLGLTTVKRAVHSLCATGDWVMEKENDPLAIARYRPLDAALYPVLDISTARPEVWLFDRYLAVRGALSTKYDTCRTPGDNLRELYHYAKELIRETKPTESSERVARPLLLLPDRHLAPFPKRATRFPSVTSEGASHLSALCDLRPLAMLTLRDAIGAALPYLSDRPPAGSLLYVHLGESNYVALYTEVPDGSRVLSPVSPRLTEALERCLTSVSEVSSPVAHSLGWQAAIRRFLTDYMAFFAPRTLLVEQYGGRSLSVGDLSACLEAAGGKTAGHSTALLTRAGGIDHPSLAQLGAARAARRLLREHGVEHSAAAVAAYIEANRGK